MQPQAGLLPPAFTLQSLQSLQNIGYMQLYSQLINERLMCVSLSSVEKTENLNQLKFVILTH